MVLRKYVKNVEELCKMKVIRNWKGCENFGRDDRECLNKLKKEEGLLKEIKGKEKGGKRKKRGVFKFIGEIRKIMFGKMDEENDK